MDNITKLVDRVLAATDDIKFLEWLLTVEDPRPDKGIYKHEAAADIAELEAIYALPDIRSTYEFED